MRGQKSKVRCQKSEEEQRSHPQITRIAQMKSRRGRELEEGTTDHTDYTDKDWTKNVLCAPCDPWSLFPPRSSSGLCDLCGEIQKRSATKGSKEINVSNSSTLSIPSIL